MGNEIKLPRKRITSLPEKAAMYFNIFFDIIGDIKDDNKSG